MRALPAILIALSLFGCDRDQKAELDRDELSRRWARASRCLIGDAPLGDDEKASERMYASELTLLARGADAPGEASADWPARCTKLIDETLALVDGPGGEAHGELRSALRLLSGTQPDMFLSGGDDKYVDQLFAAAAEAGMAPGDAGDTPAAPEPAAPAMKAELTLLGQSKGLIERVELAPSATTIRFALGAGDRALACLLSGEPSLSRARCAAIEGEPSPLFRPLSAESPAAQYFWDPQPTSRVFALGGESHEMPSSASAFVFESGTIADVLDEGLRPHLVRRLESGRVDRAPLRAPPGAKLLGFRAGGLVWRGPKRGHGVSPLILQNVHGGRIPLTGEREVGEVQPTVEHLLACRHGDRLTIAMIADGGGEEVPVEVVTRAADGRWGKPVAAKVPLGPKYEQKESWWRDFNCHAKGSVFTFIRDDQRIGQLRCSDEACESALSEPVAVEAKVSSQRIAGLGDKVLLLRAISTMAPMTGVTDMVTMRLAKISEIATTADRVLVGDEEHGGVAGVGAGVGLVGNYDAAVALLRSNEAIYALRIDPSGKLGPVTQE